MMNSLCVLAFVLLTSFHGHVAAQWAPSVPIENRTLDEIYEAAHQESGNLTVLWGGDARSQADYITQSFTRRFPKIPLNLTVDLSKYHDANLDRSFYQNSPYADVALLQTLHDFPRWKIQNRLMYYKPTNFSLIDNGEKDPDGAWLPMFSFAFGSWVYDSTALSVSDLPTSFSDVLDPKWKGKLVLTWPNDDDAIAYLFSLIVSKYGFNWLNDLAKQDVLWVRGTQTPALNVDPATRNASSAGRVLSFTSLTGGTSPAVKSASQTVDQEMSWLQRGAIMASTQRPQSAKLFISFMQSDEYQRPIALNGSTTQYPYLNEISGADPHKGNVTQVDGFPSFMLDRATVEWWRFQFELTLGTASGVDPNLLF